MQPSPLRQSPTIRNLSLGLLAIGFLIPTGCQSGNTWAPKFPTLGTPELAFGNRRKPIDEVEPPAMQFTPEGDTAQSYAQTPRTNGNMPSRPDSGLTRQPYSIDEDLESSQSRGLGGIARENSEKILDDTQRRLKHEPMMGIEGRPSDLLSDSRSNPSLNDSRLLPPGQRDFDTITGIPGGPLPNPLGRAPETPTLPGPPATGLVESKPDFGNLGMPSSGMPDNRLSQIPDRDTRSIPSQESDDRSGAQTIPDSLPGLGPPAGMGVGYETPSVQDYPPAAGPSRNPPAQPTNPTTRGQTLQPYAVPSSTGSFRPGSTANATGFDTPAPRVNQSAPLQRSSQGLLPNNPPSAGGLLPPNQTITPPPATPSAPTAPAAPAMPQPPATNNPGLPAYPTTQHSAFRTNVANPIQPVAYQSSDSDQELGNINRTRSSSGLAPYPGTATGESAQKPAGMICDGDTCYLPQQ